MAATVAQINFVAVSGRTFSKDIYLDDVAGAPINWDGGAGASATSPVDWRLPEAAYLTGFAITTGYARAKLQITRDGIPTGDILRYGINLDTLNNRPAYAIPFNAGQVIAGLQLS